MFVISSNGNLKKKRPTGLFWGKKIWDLTEPSSTWYILKLAKSPKSAHPSGHRIVNYKHMRRGAYYYYYSTACIFYNSPCSEGYVFTNRAVKFKVLALGRFTICFAL